MRHLSFTALGGVTLALVLALALTATSAVLADDTAADHVQSGDREAALAMIEDGADIDAAQPDGSTALLWAVYSVDHELAAALLEAGADPNVITRYGATPLSEAVKLGDAGLTGMLLDEGAKPDTANADGQTPLMVAAHIGALEIAERLIDLGADVNAVETFRGQTALMWAAAENHPDVAELLIANGADVSVRAAHVDWARQMTSEPRAQYRVTGGLTPLLYATRSGWPRFSTPALTSIVPTRTA